MQNIKSAEFVKGIVGTDPILNDIKPQIAFVGRSNVGKSSLINSLTGRKDLAISSSTPGRTLQLNYFLIDEKLYFVDLPGYGYSRTSLKQAEKMRKMIMWYFQYSGATPKKVVLVIDAKIGLSKFDQEMLELLRENAHPILIVANKIDKLTQSELAKQKKEIQLQANGAQVVYYSTKTKKGKEELLAALD